MHTYNLKNYTAELRATPHDIPVKISNEWTMIGIFR